MKKTLLLTIILFLLTSISFAQGGGSGQGRQTRAQQEQEIQNLKIAYITDALKLTSAESEKFWPIYNEYWAKRREAARNRRELYHRIDHEPADAAMLKKWTEIGFESARIVEKYANEFAKLLTPERAIKVFTAEEGFKNVLLHRATKKN